MRRFGTDAVPKPLDVFQQLFSLLPELFFHMVEQPVGKHIRRLHDHLVGVGIAVIARLGEYLQRFKGYIKPVLLRDHIAHVQPLCLGDGIQNGLRHAVADRGVQPFAARLHTVDLSGQLTEAVKLPAYKMFGHFPLNERNEVLRQEQRIAPARARILHGRAVAPGDLPVFQHQHHADRLACLTNARKSRRHRLPFIHGSVVGGACLDGGLIVKIKPCSSRSANDLADFHIVSPAAYFYSLGLPTSRLLLMA